MLDAFHDKIHDRLRCVDNTVRVCHLDREALEELFVNGVEEPLFLGEVRNRAGGLLNRNVERV